MLEKNVETLPQKTNSIRHATQKTPFNFFAAPL